MTAPGPWHTPIAVFLVLGALGAGSGCKPVRYRPVRVVPPNNVEATFPDRLRGLHLEKGDKVYDCGPEALTAVLHYWGDDVPLSDVVDALVIPNLNGTVSIDLQLYSRRRGFRAPFARGDIDQVRSALRARRPSIVLLDVQALPFDLPAGVKLRSIFHFFVITGISESTQEILFLDYDDRALAMTLDLLDRAWDAADRYLLVIEPAEDAASRNPEVRTVAEIYNLGSSQESAGAFGEAETYYRRALEQDPEFAPALCGLGNVLLLQGQSEEAEASYLAAIATAPDFAPARNNLAWLYVQQQRQFGTAKDLVREAILLFRNELAESPTPRASRNLASALSTLGWIYFRTDEPKRALASWQEVETTLPPEDMDSRLRARYRQSLALENLGRTDEAARIRSELLSEENLPEDLRRPLRERDSVPQKK